MKIADLPADESDRLAELRSFEILDTSPEEAFDDLTQLAAQICGTPIALVSLVDDKRQWFKAKVGIEAPETPRDIAFCAHAIHQRDLFIVPDTAQDERFADNPLVAGDPKIRFYAGMPLSSPRGHAMGTLCVIDRIPRQLTDFQQDALRQLSQHVVRIMELRRHQRQAEETMLVHKRAAQAQTELLQALDHGLEGLALLNSDGRYTYMNHAHAVIYGYRPDELIGHSWKTLYHTEWIDKIEQQFFPILSSVGRWHGEVVGRTKSGREITVEISLVLLLNRSNPNQWLLCTCRDITARKRTDFLLAAKQQNLAQAQALAHLGSWEWDLVTGTEQWSDEQFRILGYIPHALTPSYQAFREAVHPDDRTRVFAVIEEAIAQDRPYDVECRIIRPSGESRTIRCRGTAMRDDQGRPTSMTGTILDITDSKAVETQLAEASRRLQLAQESAGIGVWDYSIRDQRLVWDMRMMELYGFTPDTFPGAYDAWSVRLHPEDKPTAEQALQAAIAGGPPFDTEFRLQLPDGSIRHIKAHAITLKDDQGTAVRMVGVNYDITVRKQAEAALREQEARLRAIVDHAVDGIITIDERGTIETFNPAAERLFGYRATEAIGQNVKMLMPEPYHSEHDGYLTNYQRSGQAKIIGIGREVVGRRKDGTTFPLELSVSEMHLVNRRHFTGLVRDITERKTAAAKLEHYAQQMKNKNMELEMAHEQALAATRAKSEFLASMSHEIRTPMNAIVGMADLLQETQLSKEQQEYVGRFSRAATSLLDLINDILDISKIEAGQLELESLPFDIHDLIDKIGELMAARAFAKKLELIAFVHSDVPPFVTGDPTRLRQVLVNLVGNAIKFTERGEVTIRVEPDESKPAALRCSVSDTGIGIPEDKLHTIFDSFTQVDSSTTRKHGGTGLGLSISKRLVELMGGRIEVNSMPGHGSTFSFVVRLQEALTPDMAPPLPVLEIRGRHILVVDDSNTNRLIVWEHLKQFGPVLVEASNGPAALKALDEAQQAEKPFDLAILDYYMPDMDGLDLAQAIRERPAYASLPLVMLASDMRGQASDRARELGINAYTYKPVSRKRLLESIAVALQQTSAAPARQESKAHPASCSLPTRRILLVEDLEDNRAVVSHFLKETPYQLDMAENGAIALQKFQTGTYDLVFMDMQMPVMDGLQATAAIRQWEREQQRGPTPIVALTANAFTEELDKSLAAGCTAHLTKPIKKKTLLAAIAQHTRQPSDQAA